MSAIVGLTSLPHPREFPTKDEIRHCKSVIELLDQNIRKLEESIRKLQTQLQETRYKRANYVSYISPLRRLPTEILREIIDLYNYDGGQIITITGTCSRLREVALGMTKIWSKIRLHSARSKQFIDRYYGSSINRGIQCATPEQLSLVLTRAGPAPINLEILLPIKPGTLELLSIRNCPIHSLGVVAGYSSLINFSGFQNLNLSQLRELRLQRLQWDQSKVLMDVALQSTCNELTLDMAYGTPTLEIFKHELMRRVVNIGITIGCFLERVWIDRNIATKHSNLAIVWP
ncbi:hypothetical protein CPB86DRAFT_139614 [Serendipita vermifera]|nr:hypothetical protein CPB86DRAFT_139614 [Serendipita vermifera]